MTNIKSKRESELKVPLKPIVGGKEKIPIGGNLSKIGCCYWWKEGKKDFRISNFLIAGKYLLRNSTPELSKRIVTITNNQQGEKTIALSVKNMVSINQFCAVVEAMGNFILSADRIQFNAIKEFCVMTEEKVAIEIVIPGYQPDHGFYAFSNGIFDTSFHPVDKFGLVEINDQIFYIPALSEINKDAAHVYHNEQKFSFQSSGINFSKWSKLILEAYGNNGMIATAYIIAAIFRDVIFKHTECFPLLYLFGPPEMGKSTFTESFQRLFGDPQSPIGLGSASSSKGFSRKLAQFRNAVIVFEEYKNAIKPQLIEMLKNVYDGIGYERAQMSNDNKTHSTPVLSAVIIPGQQMPTKESALFSRVILLDFISKKFDAKTSKAYEELKDWEKKGLGKVIGEILSHRKYFSQNFKAFYRDTFNALKKDKELENLSDRNIKKMACILAPVKLLLSKENPNPLSFSFNIDDLYQELKGKLKIQNQIMERVNDINKFWGIFEHLVNEYSLKNGYEFLVENKDGRDLLYFAFDPVATKYTSEAVKQNIDVLDKESLRSYLKIQNYFIPDTGKGKGSVIKKKGFLDGKQRSCYCFDLNQTGMNPDFFKTIAELRKEKNM